MPNLVAIAPGFIAVLMGVFGLVVGSFIALVTVRLPGGEDVVSAPTQRGAWKSPRYLMLEIAAAAIGLWAALRGGDGFMIAATAVLGWQLLLIAVIDAENFWLPDILTWPLIATGLALASVMAGAVPWLQMIGAVGGFAMLWGLAWTYKRLRGRDGLGGGDPFLFAGAGAWVGWTGLPSVLLWACGAGLVVVLARLAMRRRVRGTDRLPFGTFLAFGVWLTWLYGSIGL
ncbi:A24 family peptidase [soil metagenome]